MASIVLSCFAALSCIGGGIELMVWRHGNRYLPSVELLRNTPFDSYFVPGLLLACVVGGSSLISAISAWRNGRRAIDAVIFAGGTLSVWMVVEAAVLRTFEWLSAAYTMLGVVLLGIGVRAAWRSGGARYRWWVGVTLAETAGFVAPALIGVMTSKLGIEGVGQSLLLVAGGAVEGFVLGAGQAWAFPLPVRKLRYAAWTALGAAIAWASAMTIVGLASVEAIPAPVVAAFGLAAALWSLWAMGAVQWLELRHHSKTAHRWIGWTMLAWLLALPLSFAPSPFVDETTPLGASIALWGIAGASMACVMALVTWQGVRRMKDLARCP